MQEFSVGLIPFKRNALTASVDPIKYYEYRALGLPVLSTCFGEMALRKAESGVFLVSEQAELAHQVRAALDYIRAALDYKGEALEIEQFRKANSWEVRFDACGVLS